jgi:hypothetical protein
MVGESTGWQPDPSGLHEERYFSRDGRPTRLVRNGGKTSYAAPPMSGVAIPGLSGPPAGSPAGGALSEVEPNTSGRSGPEETGPVAIEQGGPQVADAFTAPFVLPRSEEIVRRPPAGWYPDPTNHVDRRYWDGFRWTEHYFTASATSELVDVAPYSGYSTIDHGSTGDSGYSTIDFGYSASDPGYSTIDSAYSTRTRPSLGLIEVGLLLVIAALIVVLVVTGNPRLPSTSGSQSNSNESTVSTAVGEVSAWAVKYQGTLRTLDADEQHIESADNELKQTVPPNYSPAVSAAQQLVADVATDQRLPAIPNSEAESYWTVELSDLTVAAAAYFEGFTDEANGNAADGSNLVHQADLQVERAEIQESHLRSMF